MVDVFNGPRTHHRYRSEQSRAWYPTVGSSNDYSYDRYGVLPMTVETSPPAAAVRSDLRRANSFVWYANPVDPEPWTDNDRSGCFAALRAACDYVSTGI